VRPRNLAFGAGRRILALSGARCAVRDDSEIFCWGPSQFGEQGNPDFFPGGTGPRSPITIGPLDLE
jgi:hypothetical protein